MSFPIFFLTWPGPCRGPWALLKSWSIPWRQPTLAPRCRYKPPSEHNLYPGKTSWQEHPGWPGNIRSKSRRHCDFCIRICYGRDLIFGEAKRQWRCEVESGIIFNVPWSSAWAALQGARSPRGWNTGVIQQRPAAGIFIFGFYFT